MNTKTTLIYFIFATSTTASYATNHLGKEFLGNYKLVRSNQEQGKTCARQYPELNIIRNINPSCQGLTVSVGLANNPFTETTNPSTDESWGWGLDVSHICRLDEKKYSVSTNNTSHGGTSQLRGQAQYIRAGELKYEAKSYRTRLGIPHDTTKTSYALTLLENQGELRFRVQRNDTVLDCIFKKL